MARCMHSMLIIAGALLAFVRAQNAVDGGTSGAACGTPGSMRCASDGNYDVCLPGGSWQRMPCPPGTTCRATASQPALCDHSTSLTALPSSLTVPAGMPFISNAPAAPPSGFCTDGVFVCNGPNFYKCDHSAWVPFQCAPGTACRQTSPTVILCDFPGASAPASAPAPAPTNTTETLSSSSATSTLSSPTGAGENSSSATPTADSTDTTTTTTETTPTTTGGVAATETPALPDPDFTVLVAPNDTIHPANLTVPQYAVVQFQIPDGSHTIVAGSDCTPDPSSSYAFNRTTNYYFFNETGNFPYFSSAAGACQRGVVGQVTVEPPQTRVYQVQVGPGDTAAYEPSLLRVWLNSTVEFVFNNASTKHYTVTEGPGCELSADSPPPLFNLTRTSRVVFENPGAYNYFSTSDGDCSAGMRGSILVVPPSFDLAGQYVNTSVDEAAPGDSSSALAMSANSAATLSLDQVLLARERAFAMAVAAGDPLVNQGVYYV